MSFVCYKVHITHKKTALSIPVALYDKNLDFISQKSCTTPL